MIRFAKSSPLREWPGSISARRPEFHRAGKNEYPEGDPPKEDFSIRAESMAQFRLMNPGGAGIGTGSLRIGGFLDNIEGISDE